MERPLKTELLEMIIFDGIQCVALKSDESNVTAICYAEILYA